MPARLSPAWRSRGSDDVPATIEENRHAEPHRVDPTRAAGPRMRRQPQSGANLNASAALVVKDYNVFLGKLADGTATPEEIKEFATKHTAARTALAHLEHIKKCSGPDPETARAAREEELAAARTAMAEAGEDADDGDG